MTLTNPTDQVHNHDASFSPETFRQAMGPGYQSATFSDQIALVGALSHTHYSGPAAGRLANRPWLRHSLARALSSIGHLADRLAQSIDDVRPRHAHTHGTAHCATC